MYSKKLSLTHSPVCFPVLNSLPFSPSIPPHFLLISSHVKNMRADLSTHLFVITVIVSLNPIQVVSQSASGGYVVSCGATDIQTDPDGRKWSPDDKFLASSSSSSEKATTQYQDPSLPSTIPYLTARIFKSPAAYNFAVRPGFRLWVRLHFYPAIYNDLDPSRAFSTVTANGVTLLYNFSAAVTAHALTQAIIIREFSPVPSPSGFLNLTIEPFAGQKGSFAFINGIEVVPMPDIFHPAPLVGFSEQPLDVQNYSLQTMARLNVGGSYIPATKDPGLTRTWYDDTPYLLGAAFGVTNEASSSNTTVRYPNAAMEPVAPLEVYSTARSMGPDPQVNKNFNLTWALTVDPNFTYIVRLHFCDFVDFRINQKVFDIFINFQLAELGADVIGWTGSRGVAMYKDYAIYVPVQKELNGDIYVALHPSSRTRPQFLDSLLSGIEIFKVDDTRMNLGAPNPVPSDMLLKAEAKARKGFSSGTEHHATVIAVVAGGVAGCVIAAVIMYVRKSERWQMGSSHGGSSNSSSKFLPVHQSHTSDSKTSTNSTILNLAAGLCRHFSLAEIKKATKNFDESYVIGDGGFGKVYKGVIDKGMKVAIKRSNPSSDQGVVEFQTEIELLSQLRHKHLVSLIGSCEEGGEMILVYDYMGNGTFREHLYNSQNPYLSWKQRLEICVGAARGLHYLHTGAKYMIIHRDVKTTNILLDEKWVAKVSDFGLSKTGPNPHQTHVSTMVKGSFGYLDPEYFRRQQLTEKSDVYSFGVVLFEALCARPALWPGAPKEQVSLADWVLYCQKKGSLQGTVDPLIHEEINHECFKKFTETALKCLSDQGIDRPPMGDVLWNLEFCIQLLENPDRPKAALETKVNDIYATHKATMTRGEHPEISSSNMGTDNSGSIVFSQLIHPQGR